MVLYDTKDAILTNIAQRFEKRLKVPVDVTLKIDDRLGEYDGAIKDGVISAGSYGQLLDTAGRFLRNPAIENETFHSFKEMSGMYFATHNKNFMDDAPIDAVCEYIDDLAFWGMNVFNLWFDLHDYRSMDEGKEQVNRLKKMIAHANSIGVKVVMTSLGNEAFKDSPEHLRADWTGGHDGYTKDLCDHYHVEICPSKPGGMEQIKQYRREMLEAFKDVTIDYLATGAYDEGGCTCSACAPWGGNGYLRCCEEMISLYKEYFPNIEVIIGLWGVSRFRNDDDEFIEIQKAFDEGRLSACKYFNYELMDDSDYPFKTGLPRPLLGFPEISMRCAWPWGGYGANPMPKFLDEMWQNASPYTAGGYPYSEGIYEDINKVIMLRKYRDNQKAEDTIREYLTYEFGITGAMLDKAAKAVMDMEETLERGLDRPNHRYPIYHPEKAEAIEQAMQEVSDSLPESVRESVKWQVLYLRAKIDGELVRNDCRRNDKVKTYFKKLIRVSQIEDGHECIMPDAEEYEEGRFTWVKLFCKD